MRMVTETFKARVTLPSLRSLIFIGDWALSHGLIHYTSPWASHSNCRGQGMYPLPRKCMDFNLPGRNPVVVGFSMRGSCSVHDSFLPPHACKFRRLVILCNVPSEISSHPDQLRRRPWCHGSPPAVTRPPSLRDRELCLHHSVG